MPSRRSRSAALPIALVAAFGVVACAPTQQTGTVPASNVQQANPTYVGVVEAASPVTIAGGSCVQGAYGPFGCGSGTLGTVLGGVAGGLIGSTIGSGTGRAVAIGTGAALGAVAGRRASQQVQSQTGQQSGVQYVVRLEDGSRLTIVQGTDPFIPVGSSVFVQDGPGGAAVIPR
ncbi:MAG: glycine zipper 2TM domain-containing protein [Pseudomonadota bacterium]